MRSQTQTRFFFVVPLVLFGCGRAPQPLECVPGGEFPQAQEQQSRRAASTEPLTLTGTLVAPDGKVLVGHPLVLDKKPTISDWASLILLTPLVLADCLTFRNNALCDLARTAHTDTHSGYRFEVEGEPITGEQGFELFSEFPRAGTQLRGPRVYRALYPRGQHLAAGELRFWNPALELTRARDRLLVTAVDDRCRVGETVELTSETGEPWYEVSGGKVDDALLDDSPLGVRLVANSGSTRYESGVQALATETRSAPSRGAPCTVRRTDGTSEVESPCLLTDGLGAKALGGDVESVELALPPGETGSVAVRGYGTLAAKVELSSDGSSWRTVMDRLSTSQVVRGGSLSQAPVRKLRISAAEGAKSPGPIFEVLVW